MIAQHTIQEVVSKLDIMDVVSASVKLKKRGANYLGLCPFHNEKTPSFTVSPTKEIYKCFGCGKSGNTISFVMEHEKYNYVEAIKWLAARYGIVVEETYRSEEQREQVQVGESLFIINKFAQEFFSKNLNEEDGEQNPGLNYLRERGFSDEIIKMFQIGYSPDQKDAFTKQAIAAKHNPELLLKAGLVSNRNDELSDNYRGRITFPIHGLSGKIIGFGARLLVNSNRAPKYINTPENEIYVKSKTLYGSYFARQEIDKQDECLLVEGYTDVISLFQAGVKNVVASSGTSLTIDQLRLIRKYTDNLTIIYDGDPAGVKAALRGLDMAIEEGLNIKLVLLPEEEDPDSFVKKVGSEKFIEFIRKNKKDFIVFLLETRLNDAADDSAQKAVVVNEIAEIISKMNKAEDFTKQQDYVKKCSQILGIDEQGMHTLVNKHIREKVLASQRELSSNNENGEPWANEGSVSTMFDFHDSTFDLLFKDELQEREVARVLIEYGMKPWDEQKLTAHYILEEMVDESLIINKDVLHILAIFRQVPELNDIKLDKSFFIHHPDHKLSTFVVSLLEFPYEENEKWKTQYSNAPGYQKDLFGQSYEDFMKSVRRNNEKKLNTFLKAEEDNTKQVVISALNYLKLRSVKKMLLENQKDMERNNIPSDELRMLIQTHQHLKQVEIDITAQMGTVVIR